MPLQPARGHAQGQAARLELPWQRLLRSFPPETRRCGHSPGQLRKGLPVGHRLLSRPIAPQGQGGRPFDAFDPRPVHARHAVQPAAGVEPRLVAPRRALGALAGPGRHRRAAAAVGEPRQLGLDPLVAGGDRAVAELVGGQRLPQREQVSGAPGAVQRPGDRVLVLLAAAVTQLGQLGRLALAGRDRPEDAQPGHAGEVRDDVLQMDVPLGQGLLQVPQVARRLGDQGGALAQVAAPHAHRRRRPCRRRAGWRR
jgi:hypothetical protein